MRFSLYAVTGLTAFVGCSLGLYGQLVPKTVSNFVKTVESGAYVGTIFHKILPGQYIHAGKQGIRRFGDVEAPPGLESNPEVASARVWAVRVTLLNVAYGSSKL